MFFFLFPSPHSLMAKFSKKLVSKCIYIQILKCTETDLLGQFMAAGGWSLVHMWLADGITTKNWPLIQELLELLLCCPVDVERLKSNTAPKLVKSLSKDSSHEGEYNGIESVAVFEQFGSFGFHHTTGSFRAFEAFMLCTVILSCYTYFDREGNFMNGMNT